MAEKQRSSIGRKVATVGAAAIVLVAGLAAAGYVRYARTDPRSEFCTLAASIGGTLRSTPEAAFEDWWEGTFPDGPSPEDADVKRKGTVWRVYEGQEAGRWIKVEVDHPFGPPDAALASTYEDPAGLGADGWTVTAANRCGA